MAITILLCSTGVLPIYLGIALVMGENIGTTATANLAALGANTQARRAALAHLMFNVFGVIWVLCVFYPFVNMVCRLVGYDPTMSGQAERLPIVLAMFHTCFNVTNTAVLIGFIPQLERVVCWLLPEKEKPEEEVFKLKYIQANLMQTPELSVLQAQKETQEFGKRVQHMFDMTRNLLAEKDEKAFDELYNQIANQEEITDQLEIGIAKYLEQVSMDHISDKTKIKVRQLLRMISELESIGDACFKFARTLTRRKDAGKDFNEEQSKNLQEVLLLSEKALTQMNVVISGRREDLKTKKTYLIENEMKQLCTKLKEENIHALYEHEYDYNISSIYIDLINECQKLSGYVVNVVQARLEK